MAEVETVVNHEELSQRAHKLLMQYGEPSNIPILRAFAAETTPFVNQTHPVGRKNPDGSYVSYSLIQLLLPGSRAIVMEEPVIGDVVLHQTVIYAFDPDPRW